MLSELEIAAIRSRFSIFQRKIYLNSCSQGALSDAVEGSFQALLASWHQGGSPWELWTEQYEKARQTFARLIGAEADEVAVVASVSAAINSVASALGFDQRKRVVMGEFEFPTMGHVWLAQRKRGAQVEFLPAIRGRIPADSYARSLDQRTLIVPVTGVCFMNGFRSEVADIVQAAHAQGALVMLDDYQDCGTRPVDVKALDVDFYTAGTLKYLLGPSGLAFLYVKKSLLSQLVPTASGWFAQANPFAFDAKTFDPAPNARRFEAGTPPIPNIYAGIAGIELLQEIGLENIAAHIARLARALLDGARALGIRAKTPADSVGPLVVLQSPDADALVAKLAQEDVVCSSRHDGLRISFHVYNTLDDVRQVLRLLEKNLGLLTREPEALGVAGS